MIVLAWASGARRREDQSPQGQDPANAGAWFTRADPKGTQRLGLKNLLLAALRRDAEAVPPG
ncbi:hypothetical protein AB7M31_004624 [Pseudomonas sp. IAP-CY TE4608]